MSLARLALAFALLTVHVIAQSADNRGTKKPECIGTSSAASWLKLDAGPFSILAPSGWTFHQLAGVDSYVGEFVGDGVVLTFDFGRYSTELRNAKKSAYIIRKKPIGGHTAKIVSPRAPGNGITGVYIPVVGHDALCLWGKDLTTVQQELAVEIFDTIRLGGPMPSNVVPPPPPPAKETN